MAIKGKEILAALGLLRKADPADVEQALADIEALGGAAKARTEPEGAPHIRDQFERGEKHAVPSREEINTGPGQSASGSGAERMIREYSSTAPQKGVQVDAERLEKLLEDFRGYVGKAQALIGKLGELVLSKASEEKEEHKDEDDEEVAEKSATRAKRLIEKAKRLLSKAEEKEDEEEEEREEAKARELRIEAKRLRKRASRVLGDAHFAAFALHGTVKGRNEGIELLKAIRDIAVKADVDVKHEDKDDDEDGEGKSRAAAAGAGAAPPAAAKNEGTDNDKGNQSPSQDGESGNQDDSAAKAVAALQAQVQNLTDQITVGKAQADALKGVTVLEGSIKSLVEALSGQTRTGGNGTGGTKPDFAFIKGDPVSALDQIGLKIEEAIDSGRLDTFGAVRARDILQKVDAVQKGALAKSVVDNMISLAPASVQEIFQPAA